MRGPVPIKVRIARHIRVVAAGHADPCWLWTGFVDRKGYGRINLSGRSASAHRASYEAAKGPIPVGLQIDHLCRNRHCVNPAHLEAVTPEENYRRGALGNPRAPSGLVNHCPKGHEYTAETTRVTNRGRRACRTCHRARLIRHYWRDIEASRAKYRNWYHANRSKLARTSA